MTKKLFIGICINLLLFIGVLYTEDISILLFLGAIYIGPAVVNLITTKINEYRYPTLLLPSITTIIYSIFSYLFMQKQSFTNFVTSNTKNVGDLSIQINDNLLGFGPIIFVFLINFSCIYLSYKLARRKNNAYS